MVKECPVIMNNDAVTVVRFDGNDIQFPSVGQEGAKTLNVKFENGKYSIVDHAESKVENTVDESVEVAEPVKIDVKKNKKTIKKKLDDVVEE